MKMSNELFAELRETVTRYMLRSQSAKLSAERLRWDALFASGFPVNRLYDAGLNDAHIDTALRKIQRDYHWNDEGLGVVRNSY